jgi:hypothetical protein
MGPLGHALVSAPLAGAVWSVTGSADAAAATFLSGTLIDVDHLVDYVLAHGWKVDLASVKSGSYFRDAGRAFVLLHSYELVLGMAAVAGARFGWPIGFGIGLGALAHLIIDVVFYRFTPLCYSLIYRLGTGFELASFRHRYVSVQGGTKVR